MPFLRADQAAIHVSVSGFTFPAFVWQSLDGGDVVAQSLNFRPGGITPAISLGGPASRNDATVKRMYGTELHQDITKLENLCGQARMSISYTPLDADGNHNGDTIILTGTLKQVQRPSFDANASTHAQLTLVMDCDF